MKTPSDHGSFACSTVRTSPSTARSTPGASRSGARRWTPLSPRRISRRTTIRSTSRVRRTRCPSHRALACLLRLPHRSASPILPIRRPNLSYDPRSIFLTITAKQKARHTRRSMTCGRPVRPTNSQATLRVDCRRFCRIKAGSSASLLRLSCFPHVWPPSYSYGGGGETHRALELATSSKRCLATTMRIR